MSGAWYSTRERVADALDIAVTARRAEQIDAAIDAASETVRDDFRRRFHPEQATKYFTWPPRDGGNPFYVIRLDYNEVISVSAVTANGAAITGFNLEPNDTGPPYTRIEMPATGAGVTYGDTPQRNVAVTGLFGYRDDRVTVGTLSAELTSATTTREFGPGTKFASTIGVGATIVIGTERITVTERAFTDTGYTITGSLTSDMADVTVPLSSATGVVAGALLQIDSERMRVTSVVGTDATVKRAADGSVLASHSSAAAVAAPRELTLLRGQYGTTAATHALGAAVTVWAPPGPIEALTTAAAIDLFENERAGYARTVGTGDTQREARGSGVKMKRDMAFKTHGRRNRIRSV